MRPTHALPLLLLWLPALTRPAAPAPAPVSEKLYRAAPATGTAATSDAWELFLSPGPPTGASKDAARLKVSVKRRGKDAVDALLLTVSATSAAPKTVSRRQVTLGLQAGQREAEADFTVEDPGCGPARVVAALFSQREPLARAERTLRFDCADPQN